MSSVNDCYNLLKKIEKRLDSTEELLKILSVNELLDEINPEIGKTCNQTVLKESFKTILENNGFTIEKCEMCSVRNLVFLKMHNVPRVSALIRINANLCQCDQNVVPVYIFERLYENYEKRLQERKISFMVRDKEIHIYTSTDRLKESNKK